MKIAVYTIALNESEFVQRWYESAKDADYILILDTGSDDDTVEIAKKLGITVKNSPKQEQFRFDVARNASLECLPDDIDYCISLDMDEVLAPGWRDALESALQSAPNATRPRYEYIWSWTKDGSPDLIYFGDKIHSRHGYKWKHPVHEVLTTYGDTRETQIIVPGLRIEHYPDQSKPRSQYLNLLKLAVEEDKEDNRNQFYYARELYFYKNYEEAAKLFRTYLENPRSTWTSERGAALRYLAKCEPDMAEKHLKQSIIEANNVREPYLDLCEIYYQTENWENCLYYAEEALKLKNRPLDFLSERRCWDGSLEDYAAIASYRLGKYRKAIKYGVDAFYIRETDQRLLKNLKFYADKI